MVEQTVTSLRVYKFMELEFSDILRGNCQDGITTNGFVNG